MLASVDRFAPFYRDFRVAPCVALPTPELRLEIDNLPFGHHSSVPEHTGIDEHDMPANAFELHEITRPEIGQPGVVEGLHPYRSLFVHRRETYYARFVNRGKPRYMQGMSEPALSPKDTQTLIAYARR